MEDFHRIRRLPPYVFEQVNRAKAAARNAGILGTGEVFTGKLVKGKQKNVTDGPFAEAKDIVGGYTLIEARDLEQAVELSKGCPILEVEGAVEVRPVMKIDM